MFQELLDNIIAEDVFHELGSIGLDLSEYLVLHVAIGGGEFLLDESRALLISAELNDMAVNVLTSGRETKC